MPWCALLGHSIERSRSWLGLDGVRRYCNSARAHGIGGLSANPLGGGRLESWAIIMRRENLASRKRGKRAG